MHRAAAAFAALSLAAAAPAPAAEGLFLGDRYRYDAMPVARRALHDLVALPADVVRWETGDAAAVVLVLAAGGALMLPLPRPADARLDRWISREVNPRVPEIWTPVMQPLLWGGIAAGGLGTWWWAGTHDRPELAQGLSLMGESVAVAQAYHLTVKLLVGREGPRDGVGEARIRGPAAALRLYPAGTPSGHATTLFALASAGCAFFRPPALAEVAIYGAVGALAVFHVTDHRHFLSDTVLGAGLGYGVGQWVVRHRASSSRAPAGGSGRASLVPSAIPLPGGGAVALAGAW